jgi:2-oxoglutarate ferredoxin oxidoreductase subunit beta
MTTKLQNHGVISTPFNALAVALVTGATFVARGFSGNEKQLTDLICRAVSYKGFSIIEILQPCVSFNKINTFGWYNQRVYDLEKTGHDPSDFSAALNLTQISEDKIPTGIYYQQDSIPFHERIQALQKGPLISRPFESQVLKKMILDLA